MRKLGMFVAGLMVLVMVVLAACGPGGSPAATEKSGPAPQAAKAAWEQKWETVVEAAKKEGVVRVYSSAGEPVRSATIEGFKARYGIPLEYTTLTGPEAAAKIQAERRAGLYLLDVLLGASDPGQTVLKPAGVLDPLEPTLILPEVTDPKYWWQGKLPWVDSDHYGLCFVINVNIPLIINTQLVKPEEVKSWRDLLNPKWKGNMTIYEPTKNTSGNFIIAFLGLKAMGMDYVKQLVKQDLVITSDRRQLVEWVARGKYAMALNPEPPMTQEFLQAGSPILQVIPAEGTYVSGWSGFLRLIKQAPNPNAATVFINWQLGKEGQTLYSKTMGVQSAREDVPTDHLNPMAVRRPGINYYPQWTEEFLLSSPDRLKMAGELFAPYLKK